MNNFPKGPVLVTGGSGFLAQHTIRLLLERGLPVRTTIRSREKAAALRRAVADAGLGHDGLDIVEADLLDPTGWDRAVSGARGVLHMATSMSGKDVTQAALAGTRHVIEASAAAGVRRIVLTSSGLAAMPRGKTTVTAADWTDKDQPGLPEYAGAKTRAERLAWELAARHGLDLTTILPGVILGPALGEDRPVWLGVIAAMLEGRMPVLPPVSLQVVDVRDVAALHADALVNPVAIGRRYLAAGDTLSFRDMADILRSDLGAGRVSTWQMPLWLLRVLALGNAEVRQLASLRGAPRMDSAHTAGDLAWTARPARQSVLDAARSLGP